MIAIFSKQLKLTLLTIALISISGCQLYDTKNNYSADESSTNELGPIVTMADDPTAQRHRQLANQLLTYRQQVKASDVKYCQYFAMGYSACEGPARYIVYSTQEMSENDIVKLNQKIDEFNQLDAVQKKLHMIHSHCTALPAPEVSLVDGSCRATNAKSTVRF